MMARIKFEYGTWDNIMGYTCGQCGRIFPFIEGAMNHENDIDDNDGTCPNVEAPNE